MKISDVIYETNNDRYSEEFMNAIKYYMTNGVIHPDYATIFDTEMPVLTDSHTVYRGINFDASDKLPDHMNFMKHDRIIFPDYSSVSIDWNIAHAFMTGTIYGGPVSDAELMVLFIIETKPGVRGVEVDSMFPDEIYADEKEIILAPSEFKVIDKIQETDSDNDFKYWEVKLEQTE